MWAIPTAQPHRNPTPELPSMRSAACTLHHFYSCDIINDSIADTLPKHSILGTSVLKFIGNMCVFNDFGKWFGKSFGKIFGKSFRKGFGKSFGKSFRKSLCVCAGDSVWESGRCRSPRTTFEKHTMTTIKMRCRINRVRTTFQPHQTLHHDLHSSSIRDKIRKLIFIRSEQSHRSVHTFHWQPT